MTETHSVTREHADVVEHRRVGRWSAARVTASTFGVLAGLGGIRHGIGEIRQGNVGTDGFSIESWTDGPVAEHFDGEPAFTVVPNMLATGVLAIGVSLLVIVWAGWFVDRRHGGLVLSLLSVAMLLLGGGVGPPVVGALAGWPGSAIGDGLERRRHRWTGPLGDRLAPAWPWTYALATSNGIFLMVVSFVLITNFGLTNADLLLASFGASVILLVATTACAIARDVRRERDAEARLNAARR